MRPMQNRLLPDETAPFMRIALIVAALFALAPGAVSYAADTGGGDMSEKLAAMLRKAPEADANKDGVLTMEEAQAFRSKKGQPKNARDGKTAASKSPSSAKTEAPGQSQAGSGSVETRVYKTIGPRKLIVEIHYPDGWRQDDHRAALVIFHGNAMNPRNKAGELYPTAEERARLGLPVPENTLVPAAFLPQAEYFAKRGMVTMRVEYRRRGTDGVMPDAGIEDAISAMRWVRKNASTLGIDPNRIATMGGSGGGHLAASVACIDEFQAPDDDRSVSPMPNAMLLYFPSLDLLAEGSMSEAFLQVAGDDREYADRISPGRHWSKDKPPTIVFIGTTDPMFESLKKFVAQWKEQGAPIDIYIGEGGHGFATKSPYLEKTTVRADEFLRSLGCLGDEPRVEPPSLDKDSKKGKTAAQPQEDQ